MWPGEGLGQWSWQEAPDTVLSGKKMYIQKQRKNNETMRSLESGLFGDFKFHFFFFKKFAQFYLKLYYFHNWGK